VGDLGGCVACCGVWLIFSFIVVVCRDPVLVVGFGCFCLAVYLGVFLWLLFFVLVGGVF